MSLILCPHCQQHYIENQCPHCEPIRRTSPLLPVALLLGIGCHKREAEPQVMALYGGPPVEAPAEETTGDTDINNAHIPSSTDENAPPAGGESTTQDDTTAHEVRPEREIMALYGAPPMEPIRVPSLDKKEDKNDEKDNDSNTETSTESKPEPNAE